MCMSSLGGQALARCPLASLAVGIENGMWCAADPEAQGPSPAWLLRAHDEAASHVAASPPGTDSTVSGWLDGACVAVLATAATGDVVRRVVTWSADVPVPAACLVHAVGDWPGGSGPSWTGASDGSVVPVTRNWSALKDPHVLVCGNSRQVLLRDAVAHAIQLAIHGAGHAEEE